MPANLKSKNACWQELINKYIYKISSITPNTPKKITPLPLLNNIYNLILLAKSEVDHEGLAGLFLQLWRVLFSHWKLGAIFW